jgi:hypothetical protein
MDDIKFMGDLLKACAESGLTPMLWGKHGIGKSQIVRQVFEDLGYEVIDLRLGQLEVGDLIGMPAHEYYCPNCKASFGLGGNLVYCPICKNSKDHMEIPIVGRTIWLPPSWFPQGGEKRCFFFDEFNRGRLDVQQAAFQIVLDHRIHTHKIPDNCAIVCAANPSGGDYNVEELDPALLNRFINIKWTLPSSVWKKWAVKNNIVSDIVDFIDTDPKFLGNDPIDVPIDVKPTPRGYEFLSKLLAKLPRPYWQDVANMIIGQEAALAFIQSLKTDLDKPLKAKEIFDNFAKVKKQVQAQLDAKEGTRFDLLRVTLDEIGDALKGGKSKKYTMEQLNNVANFLVMLPQDLAFSALKDLAPEQDINERLLLKRNDLFDILKSARKTDIK